MKILVAMMSHETNTFSEVAADYAAFDGTSAEAPGGAPSAELLPPATHAECAASDAAASGLVP